MQCLLRYDIHFAGEQGFEIGFQAAGKERSSLGSERDEKIEIAPFDIFAAGNRAEYPNVLGPVLSGKGKNLGTTVYDRLMEQHLYPSTHLA